MRTRTLSLKKETLAELATSDLAQVVGGQVSGLSCTACGSDLVSCYPTYRCTLHDCVVTIQGCATSLDVC